MNTISTPLIEAIISRNEIIELIDANHDMSDLVLISISEPVLEGYNDESLTDSQVANFKDSLRVKFWDITDPIGHYDIISDETALLLQQFILSHISDRFIIHCRAGQSRSAGVGKAIECIKHFGIGDAAKFNYQTSFNSEIDAHSRYCPNLTVFDSIVKDYNAH